MILRRCAAVALLLTTVLALVAACGAAEPTATLVAATEVLATATPIPATDTPLPPEPMAVLPTEPPAPTATAALPTDTLAPPPAVVPEDASPQAPFTDSGQRLGAGRSGRVALGDLDGDRDLDAFVANWSPGVSSAVWINDGWGAFESTGQSLGYGHLVRLGDLDGDGDLDAFVTGWSDPATVWLNEGSGTFTNSGQRFDEGSAFGVGLGDLDGDGDLDAFLAQEEADEVWLNGGVGIFQDSGQSLGAAITADVALGDLDGDGDLDALACGWGGPAKVWLNDGLGAFADSGHDLTSAEVHVHGVDLGDVDGDGDLDAVLAIAGSQPNQVWLNDGVGVFSDSGQELRSDLTHDVTLEDLDGDGDLDALMAIAAYSQGYNKVWLNDGQGVFADSGLSLGDQPSYGIALGDLDADTDLDAFITHGDLSGGSGGGLPNEVWLNGLAKTAVAVAGGGEIAFYSERDGDAEIYLMNDDGSNQRPLTDNDVDDVCPAWSPDGTQLLFVTARHDPNPGSCFPECRYEIYVMNADGTDQRRLTEDAANDFHPIWSPDGAQIAFVSDRDGNNEIYVMDADGGNPRRLTDEPAADMRPFWSPDGTQIVFNSERDGNWEIYLMDADGSNQRRLTEGSEWELFPAWSPDGTEIAYFMAPSGSGRPDVYVMAAPSGTGTSVPNARQLTNHPRVDEDPAWSPDGTQIAFQSSRDGNFEIYVMEADGSNQRRLTDDPGGDYWPAWRPSPASAAVEQRPGVLQMLTVYDNTSVRPGLVADWGFGAWLEYEGHVVLFDTGGNGRILLGNMEELGLDPARIEIVVLSHAHGDHIGGLEALLRTGVEPVVYVPASLPAAFKEEVRAQTELVEVTDPIEILPGIHSTGEFRAGVREQGLIVETSEGIVVITGCAHPGITRMVETAHRIVEEDIALVVGGFHLAEQSESTVRRIVADFREMGVEMVSPTHCTGPDAIAVFAEEYGDGYVEGGVGQVYLVGSPEDTQ